MPLDDKSTDLDPIAKNIIRRKALYLRRKGGFSSTDVPDLEQDLSLHLLQRLPTFDSRKADWAVFVTVVVTAWGANLLRDRYAAKRDCRRTRRFPSGTETNDRATSIPAELVSQERHDARLGLQRPNEQERLELKLDVQETLQRLPDDLRSIAERLQHCTPAELARELGMPRTTLYESIQRLRRRFERIGLGKNP